MKWKRVETNGFPYLDGETVYVGINDAGYWGCFNGYHADKRIYIYNFAGETIEIMGNLKLWKCLRPPK